MYHVTPMPLAAKIAQTVGLWTSAAETAKPSQSTVRIKRLVAGRRLLVRSHSRKIGPTTGLSSNQASSLGLDRLKQNKAKM